MNAETLSFSDPEIFQAIYRDTLRQQDHLVLIASENYVSEAALEAQGSVLTNKYAEGYPGKRYYGGCEYVDVVDRIARKIASSADSLPEPIVASQPDAEIGIVAVGSSDGAVREAIDRLAEQGVQADYMRIRAFPFHDSVEAFLEAHDRVFVVEQNRDAQLRSLLTLETNVPQERLIPVRYYGGLSLSANHVLDGVLPHLGESAEESAAAEGGDEVGSPATTTAPGGTGAAKPKVGAS